MKIAILGANRINELIKGKFGAMGFTLRVFDDLSKVKSIGGEPGAFIVSSKDGDYEADFIIVTEEPVNCGENYGVCSPVIGGAVNSCKAAITDGTENVCNASNAVRTDRIITAPMPGFPTALILDHPVESPAQMTRAALEMAVGLLEKKKKVIYLAKFIRTAGDGLEALYRKARNLGAVFFRYDDIKINYLAGEGIYQIEIRDAAGGIRVLTHYPIFFGNAGYNHAFLKIADLLKLRRPVRPALPDGLQRRDLQTAQAAQTAKTVQTAQAACLDGSRDKGNRHKWEDWHGGPSWAGWDEFFLFPAMSNRKGVYFANTWNTSGGESEIMLKLDRILADISRVAEDSGKFAEIDEGKCAFCCTCFRICPHIAMQPDGKSPAMKNLHGACLACGICESACPAGAISVTGENGRKVPHSHASSIVAPAASVISAFAAATTSSSFSASNKTNNTGRIKLFCCKNSGEAAFGMIIPALREKGIQGVEMTPLECGGGLSVELLISSLELYEKVLVAVCMDGACRHFEGNLRAARYVEKAKEMLAESGMDETRISCLKLSHAATALLDEYISNAAANT